MAKTKVKKVKKYPKSISKKAVEETVKNGALVKRVTLEDGLLSLNRLAGNLQGRVWKLEQRIDRLVEAIDKSKSVRYI